MGDVYDQIDQRVCWLHAHWKQYRILFADRENIRALNNAGGFIARMIQDLLWDMVLLGISRLCDPKDMGTHENLSLDRLIQALPEPTDHALQNQLEATLREIRSRSDGFVKHRHKRIAHIDLAQAISSVKTLPPISRTTVEDALAKIREFMALISTHYGRGITAYCEIDCGMDAESLLVYLRKGIQVFRLLEELDWGRISESDFIARLRSEPIE